MTELSHDQSSQPGEPSKAASFDLLVALAGVLGLFALFLQAVALGNEVKYLLLGIGLDDRLDARQWWATLPDFLSIAFGSAIVAFLFGNFLRTRAKALAVRLPPGLKELPKLVALSFIIAGLVHFAITSLDLMQIISARPQ